MTVLLPRNRTQHTMIVCVVVTAMAGCEPAPSDRPTGPLEGVWEVIERSYQRGDSTWVVNDPEPGLYLFSKTHYGVQEIRESGPRPLFTDQTTAAERLAAFEVYHGHTGIYRLEGSTLWITPSLAKGPNTMDGGTSSYRIEWEGELLRVIRDAPAEAEVRETTLRRVE